MTISATVPAHGDEVCDFRCWQILLQKSVEGFREQ